jgi:hypothetical protein
VSEKISPSRRERKRNDAVGAVRSTFISSLSTYATFWSPNVRPQRLEHALRSLWPLSLQLIYFHTVTGISVLHNPRITILYEKGVGRLCERTDGTHYALRSAFYTQTVVTSLTFSAFFPICNLAKFQETHQHRLFWWRLWPWSVHMARSLVLYDGSRACEEVYYGTDFLRAKKFKNIYFFFVRL